MMDAPDEEQDVKLQQMSHDLIADFGQSLNPYLRKQDSHGGTILRSRVRVRETTRLISSLLDPFQELPQLLDQHLPKWLPLLSESFLEYLLSRKRTRAARSTRSDLLMPLSTGICKILYTFCKIRGEKVIVRFLNNETKYLELLASALEECERNATGPDSLQWSWEERYIVLLWLSHLFLAPFDLASISSADVDEEDLPSIPGLTWPNNLPGITARVMPLAIKYLESPGKERDAAKALLVRIAMRRDMQALGVLDALVHWSLAVLRPRKEEQIRTPYYYIGVLSFLSGSLAASSDTSDMTRYMQSIFTTVYETTNPEDTSSADATALNAVTSSAIARKISIKIIRSLSLLSLRLIRDQGQEQDVSNTMLVASAIGYFLSCLSDNDTPVRLGASKALSVVTLKLDPFMASQVVDAVLESLNRNVLWSKRTPDGAAPVRDLSAVNPLEWHGLMMTLGHLIYRRSPPAEKLTDIVNALILGLSFEQRSASGGSIGTNVRDAACFGIWALARRYTTSELLAVPTGKTISHTTQHYTAREKQPSILQILASELVIAGCLDPAGNIRRGSSAALQELIGRHPDAVEKGIAVVQTVDYHAVALRSRAMGDVSLGVARVYKGYGAVVRDALLSWRVMSDADGAARRAAAASFGRLTAELTKDDGEVEGGTVKGFEETIGMVMGKMRGLMPRQVEERHGLVLALAAVLDEVPGILRTCGDKEEVEELVQEGLEAVEGILADERKYRRSELVAEAASCLVVSSFPLLQLAVLGRRKSDPSMMSGSELVASDGAVIADVVASIDAAGEKGRKRLVKLVRNTHGKLREWLVRSEEENIAAAAQAGLVLLCFCEPELREEIIRGWALIVGQRSQSGARVGSGASGGYFAALCLAYPITSTFGSRETMQDDRNLICRTLMERWRNDKDIDTRVAILKSLTGTEVLRQNAIELLGLVEEGLDDYTTNARGDVGSLVRLQAIRATKSLWQTLQDHSKEEELLSKDVSRLFPRILRLAAEKLDRVRVDAQATLALALNSRSSSLLTKLTFSSRSYFHFLLSLLSVSSTAPLHPIFRHFTLSPTQRQTCVSSLLSGYVTSADTGDENLVISSRAALTTFCASSADNLTFVRAALVKNLRHYAGQDRVVVPTLEVIAFLFHVGLFPQTTERAEDYGFDYKNLCLLVQKAGYKTGNVRKAEACVRVYGAVAALKEVEAEDDVLKTADGKREARKRLGALLLHPWPRVRSVVVDELWALFGVDTGDDEQEKKAERLLGVDWGEAGKADVKRLVEELGLA